ncbi:hypothetical protein GOBAR_DD26387 [Gossypium barbadense]|nr:hypothetical protein GOBAR_DD26387 [Gossypium barbadense]
MDPKTGFYRQTGIYSCLRPPVPLPPISQPLSAAEFCFSIFNSTFTDGATTFSVNTTTGKTLSYSQFVSQVRSLTYSLQQRYSLSQNDVAFILSPPSIHIPVVYFALLSLGLVVSPANPLSSNSEIAHQIQLSKPVVAFVTSETSHKIPSLNTELNHRPSQRRDDNSPKPNRNDGGDSSPKHEPRPSRFGGRFDFEEMLRAVEKYKVTGMPVSPPLVVAFVKSDLTRKYDLSSLQRLGCGGAPLGKDIAMRFNEKFPGVLLVQPLSLPQYALSLFHNSSHASATAGGDTTFIVDAANGNTLSYSQFIAQIYSLAYSMKKNFSLSRNDVAFILSPPSFHVPSLYFALMLLGIVVSPATPLGSESEITHQVKLSKPVIAFATSKTSSKLPSLKLGTVLLDSPISPSLVVAFTNSELTKKYDLSSLMLLGSGGAPLGKEVSERFKEKFPTVELIQGYGLTETGGGATRVIEPEEAARYGSVGRLAENMEGKIVDPETGEALPPGRRGELWLRGPTVMKGYVGDEKATAETLDSEGWLKTGDICYFDSEGFLYVVDRLKELIKYKAYQVPPAELEHLLLSHPEIVDAAVIPYPNEEAGQIPMAYVVRNPGSNITEAQVMDFIAKQACCTVQEDPTSCFYKFNTENSGREDLKEGTR